MKIIERIQLAKQLLKETNDQFGKRFNVTEKTVSRWDLGQSEAPYHVIEFCEYVIEHLQICPACGGTGVFNKTQKAYIIALGDEGMDLVFPAGDFKYSRTKPPTLKMIAGKPESFIPEVDELPTNTSVSKKEVSTS